MAKESAVEVRQGDIRKRYLGKLLVKTGLVLFGAGTLMIAVSLAKGGPLSSDVAAVATVFLVAGAVIGGLGWEIACRAIIYTRQCPHCGHIAHEKKFPRGKIKP